MATVDSSSDFSFSSVVRVPPIDTRTGLVAREWVRFFQEIFIRTGNTEGVDTQVIETLVTTLYNSVRPVNTSQLETAVNELVTLLGTSSDPRASDELHRAVEDLSARLLAVEKKISAFDQPRALLEELRAITLAS